MSPMVRKFSEVYKDDASNLPLLNLTRLEGKEVTFHSIEETDTALGSGFRIIVTLPDDETRYALLCQPNVVTKQLAKAARDKNLPIMATVKKVKRYYILS